MAHHLTTAGELRNMTHEDLARELAAHRMTVAKMRLDVRLKKDTDTGRFRRERRQLARMLTVMAQKAPVAKKKESLKQKPKSPTIHARSAGKNAHSRVKKTRSRS